MPTSSIVLDENKYGAIETQVLNPISQQYFSSIHLSLICFHEPFLRCTSNSRYITLKIIPVKKTKAINDVAIKNTDLYKAILSKVKKLHGDYGIASVKTGFICK